VTKAFKAPRCARRLISRTDLLSKIALPGVREDSDRAEPIRCGIEGGTDRFLIVPEACPSHQIPIPVPPPPPKHTLTHTLSLSLSHSLSLSLPLSLSLSLTLSHTRTLTRRLAIRIDQATAVDGTLWREGALLRMKHIDYLL